MIRILGRDDSLNVRKVLWCCDELGLDFEREDYGGPFGRTDSPEYRALNPNGLVPTVIDGDLAIWESNTIMRYLAAKYGGAPLYDPDPGRRSLTERWMDWQLSTLQQVQGAMFLNLVRLPPDKRDAAAVARNRDLCAKAMAVLDGALAAGANEGPYIAGRDLTLGDIPLGLAVNRWFLLDIPREDLPALATYYETLKGHAGYRKWVANGKP